VVRDGPAVRNGPAPKRPLATKMTKQLRRGGSSRSHHRGRDTRSSSFEAVADQLATIFRALTSLSVAMFALAISWKRYSLPIRRAGSPRAGLTRTRMPKVTPARCSIRRASTRLACDLTLVERSGAAHPVQYSMSIRDRTVNGWALDVQGGEPFSCALEAPSPHRVSLVLHVAEAGPPRSGSATP